MKLLSEPKQQRFELANGGALIGHFFVVIDFEMPVAEGSVFSGLRFAEPGIELREVRVWQHVTGSIYICGYAKWKNTD